jgi:hypothetical protein
MLIEDSTPMQEEDLSFRPDLERRILNLALGPTTPSNALVPIFEAVYNSLHAINDRFRDKWCELGQITIALIDFAGSSPSVEIRDNGIGLDKQNFQSFRTYDSSWKVGRGGKGVGRLAWLKVFQRAEISSNFAQGDIVYNRSFALVPDNNRPIANYKASVQTDANVGTTVKLCNMRPEYVRHMPTQTDTIIRKLVAHFLPYLISADVPSIWVETEDASINLIDFLAEKKIVIGSLIVDAVDEEKLTLNHNLLERGIVEGKASHKLYLAAHGRVVADFDVGQLLGLTNYIDASDGKHVYAGVLSGDFLDSAVNAERTNFDFDQDTLDGIRKHALVGIREVLSAQIERVIQQQTELTRSVVKKFPRYAYLVDNPRSFAEHKIPRNFRSAEQIYQQLALFDFRENRDIERKVEALSKNTVDGNVDPIEEGVQTILNRLSQQEFSVLADYTVRRKVVLDLLEKRLGYRGDGTMKYHAEEALHKFVVPMRVENHDVHIDDHNLWIVDDKLTYYEHWASDKQMKSIVEKDGSANRPDVILFGGRTAYHRPGTDQPVVIIEFKKPARNDYNDDENPFTQIYGYIEELRAGRVPDREGAIIQEVNETTPFFCYIIADITPKLRTWLKMAQVNVPLPGGSGFYGYNSEYNAFVQALSYKYVLKDARLRNEAFFKRLKI